MCRCQQHGNDNAIRSYRTLTEVRLLDLLEQRKSTATLDDIKRFIFEESGRRGPVCVSRIEAEISPRFRCSIVDGSDFGQGNNKAAKTGAGKTRFGDSRLAAKPFAAQQ